MPETILQREDQGRIATLTLNAPQNLNALSLAMLAALQLQIDALNADTRIKTVILRANGRAFCAGHDLREIAAARQSPDAGRTAFADLFNRCAAVMTGLARLPQPVIAEVQGLATAAGCQLVASCDLAIAAQDARFGVNGVNIGLFCSTPMVALSRNIPRKQAFEMLTTGDFITAARAAELGLINRAVAPEALSDETRALATRIAGKLGSALRIGKRAFYEQIDMPLDQAYAYTGAVMLENLAQDDTAEGIAAFLEKRAPDWPE